LLRIGPIGPRDRRNEPGATATTEELPDAVAVVNSFIGEDADDIVGAVQVKRAFAIDPGRRGVSWWPICRIRRCG